MAIRVSTVTGRLIDLAAFRAEDVALFDIATGLAHACRFAGQIDPFYSVADHSILVESLLPPSLKLAGLVHDASEAYMTDLPRPLKHSPGFQAFMTVEKRITHQIEQALGLTLTDADRALIKAADDVAVCFEHTVMRLKQPWTFDTIPAILADGAFLGPRNAEETADILRCATTHYIWLCTAAQTFETYARGAHDLPAKARDQWLTRVTREIVSRSSRRLDASTVTAFLCQRGWLIEAHGGFCLKFTGLGDGRPFSWTTIWRDGTRFARKEDAESALTGLRKAHSIPAAYVAEHLFDVEIVRE